MCATLINAVTHIPDMLENQVLVPLCPPFTLQAKSHQNTRLDQYSMYPLQPQTCWTCHLTSSLAWIAPAEKN